ncbi:aminotransferase class I/II-fold pyridoxal phosphate-dependent enzyme [Legionella gresilensis]|uniref:aminotransferase class I/II-fold pyridoxal phosphate-dependent enzyme n=1 Tax=Legionella gresilensis TaxID=91823 RepID=UPI001040E415|nr:aminotransferase class I/II-fold pyridoxal phosphate-dependent enzyme [Legionella gresilensis]
MSSIINDEKISLKQLFRQQQKQNYQQRIKNFAVYSDNLKQTGLSLFHRKILSPADRVVKVACNFESQIRYMLMFGSNNYLGFANHSYIKNKVNEAINKFGVGIGGPPLLNGNHYLLTELERRLAQFKGYEDALVFPSGYATNLGLFSALPFKRDIVIVDEKHHASCFDGLKLKKIPFYIFEHNNIADLDNKIQLAKANLAGDCFIAIEGVYSMQGNLAKLPEIILKAQQHKAILILDDAHATGVLGDKGKGTMNYFKVSEDNCLSMGTFSKTFAVTGGFVCGNRDVIEYLRYFARSYMFSGSLSPMQCAAVLAGLDLLENEPHVQQTLLANCQYAIQLIRQLGIEAHTDSAILILPLKPFMNIEKVALDFHKNNIFVNTIKYPAVEEGQECVRISFSAIHTKEDIEHLVNIIEKIWVLEDKN